MLPVSFLPGLATIAFFLVPFFIVKNYCFLKGQMNDSLKTVFFRSFHDFDSVSWSEKLLDAFLIEAALYTPRLRLTASKKSRIALLS